MNLISHYSIAVQVIAPGQFVPALTVYFADGAIAYYVAAHNFARDTTTKINRDINRDVREIQSHYLHDNPAHVDRCARAIIDFYRMTAAGDPEPAPEPNPAPKSRSKPRPRPADPDPDDIQPGAAPESPDQA